MPSDLTLLDRAVGPWLLPAVVFPHPDASLALAVQGLIGNSITTSETGARRTREWKCLVTQTTKGQRGSSPWNPALEYSISLGFAFHLPSHGNRQLDVENFIKPTLDALAAGLFCANDSDPTTIERYDFDDSNFRHLFIQRLADASSASSEGIAIYLCSRSIARKGNG